MHPLLVGGNPFTTTSIYTLILYLEKKWGIHYSMGGTGNIIKGLETLMTEEGIEIIKGQEVTKIISLNKANILITQNIDGLHQQSGMNQDQIIEIHGNAKRAACLDCYKINNIQSFHDSINKDLKLPVCSSCGGIVKVATISFGQPMKEEDMMKASDASKACDLMLVMGSSLKVMPAGKIPGLAITSGAKVVILNRDKTRYDSKADVVINDELENICSKLNNLF